MADSSKHSDSDVNHYFKKKVVKENISAEYSSESDEITVEYNNRLNNGASIGMDYLRFHPSYVEPLIQLLREVVKDE